MNIMRQIACLAVNPITITSLRLNDGPGNKALSWLGLDDMSLVGPTGVQLLDFCCSSVSELVCYLALVLFHLSDES